MDEQTRRAWSRPELIVLVRRGQEEAVLTDCKHENTSYQEVHPDGAYTSCLVTYAGETCSDACSNNATS